MKFYNAFGIKPTNSFTSAGTDYYIPNLKYNDMDKIPIAYEAFAKSYNKTIEEIHNLHDLFYSLAKEYMEHIPNLIHLFLGLYDPYLEQFKKESLPQAILIFLNEFVVYDSKNNKIGIKVRLNDTLFINSGIKIALDTVLSDKISPNPRDVVNKLKMIGIGIAGLYVNKSGKGNAGWDVRACLVDEDYSGYVHLSQAYTKDLIEDGQNIIYCGDKLTQMMLIPIFHEEYIDVSKEEYDKIMENSERGDKGFGSQDIKH